MFRLGVFFLILSLGAGQAAICAAQTPLAPSQAPVDAGRCFWAQLPQSSRDKALAATDDYAANEAARGSLEGPEILRLLNACGVTKEQYPSARHRIARWISRLWAESRLLPLTPARLDAAYQALPPGDKSLLQDLRRERRKIAMPEISAFLRFNAALGVAGDETREVAAMHYLIARLDQEVDLAKGL